MANYFVINNRFRPYSFDELVKPYQMYNQAYREQEAAIDAAREKEFSANNLNPEYDAEAYGMYNSATDNLRKVSNELATQGLSGNLMSRIRSTARDYSSTMNTLTEAQKRLDSERDRRLKAGDGYVYQQENLRIGDFLNGRTPNTKGANLDAITKDIATEFSTRAKSISKDTWDKVFDKNGKVVGGYFDVTTESGLSTAQLDSILDDTVWNRIEQDSSISQSEKDKLRGFRNVITDKKSSLEYDKYSQSGKGAIDQAIAVGAHAGLGGTTHAYREDRSYNPLGWANYKLQEKQYNDAKAQRDIANGIQPFFTDSDNTKYFSNGKAAWAVGPDGKLQTIPEGTFSKPNGSSSSSSSSGSGGGSRTQRKFYGGVTSYDTNGQLVSRDDSIDKANANTKRGDFFKDATQVYSPTDLDENGNVVKTKDGADVKSISDRHLRTIADRLGMYISPGEIDNMKASEILNAAYQEGLDIYVKNTKRSKDGKIKSQELIVVDNKTTITKNQNDTLEESDNEYNSNAEPV